MGSTGDSYDNALAETINGLYKAEIIHRRGPWKTTRGGRAGHAGMGLLVQPPSPAGAHRLHPAGRSRGKLLTTRLDARNKLTTYSYDALNRLTLASHGDPLVTHDWDSCTHGIGHSARSSTARAIPSSATTPQGRLTGRSQTVGSVTLATAYGYNGAGQLTQLTTPTGQVIALDWSNGKVTALRVEWHHADQRPPVPALRPGLGLDLGQWSNPDPELRPHRPAAQSLFGPGPEDRYRRQPGAGLPTRPGGSVR